MRRVIFVAALVLAAMAPVWSSAEDVDEFVMDDMELEELTLEDEDIEEIAETTVVVLTEEEAVKMADPGAGAAGVVRTIYTFLIVILIGAMLLHNLLIWFSFVIKKIRDGRKTGRSRFAPVEMLMHVVLIFSFAGLAYTGFALPYSDLFIFKWIYDAGLTDARALAHRVFAVLLLADLAVFLVYSITTRTGRLNWWRRMWPGFGDLKELAATISYHAGLRDSPPAHPHFNYAEKAEYWALLWGTVIMGVTGLALWFKELLPVESAAWWESVAGAVHFYEALLSVLAITVWHLFFVLIHPEKALQIPLPKD